MGSQFRNEDIGMSVIRRVNKFYDVQYSDMDEMKVIFWVQFDHEDADTLALLNKFINDIDDSKTNPHAKKRPYVFEFGFGNPKEGGEIHTLKGLKDNDSFVLSAWYDDTNAIYSQEEYSDHSEDIYYIISNYLHRLKCDKGAHYGESYFKGEKMNLSEALSNIILDGGVEKGLSEIMNFTNANKYGWTYSQLMNTWKLTKQELEENGVLEVPYPNRTNKKLGIDIIDDRLEHSVKAITGLEISDFDAYGEGAQIIKAIRKLFINEWQKIAADKGLKVESVMSLSEAKQELREHGYKIFKD